VKKTFKNPEQYDNFYNNEQAYRENVEIATALNNHLEWEKAIIDLGCGTGLGYKLIDGGALEYIGVDQSSGPANTFLYRGQREPVSFGHQERLEPLGQLRHVPTGTSSSPYLGQSIRLGEQPASRFGGRHRRVGLVRCFSLVMLRTNQRHPVLAPEAPH